jgi:hypothetical protein
VLQQLGRELLGYLARYYRRADLISAYLKIAPMDRVNAKEAPYIEDLRRRRTLGLDVFRA